MTYPYNVTKVTISGTCFAGAEIWSTGFYLGKEDASVSDATQANVDSIATKWQTFFTHADARIQSTYKTERVKMATYFASGGLNTDNIVYHDYAPVISGGGSGAAFPPQCTLVATLRSVRAHGKASHGRMYIPGFCGGIQSDGRIAGNERDAFGVKFKEFLTAVRNDTAQPGYPILEAKGGTIAPFAESAYVYSVKVGNVVDTQRRRRNGLTEVYYSGNI